MSRLFYHICQDNEGNLLFNVSGTMRLAGTGTAATIYGNEALTVILPNPMTNHPSFASFKCYLAPGSYDFYMAKSGYTFETLTGVQGSGTLANLNSPLPVANGGTAAADAATARTNLGLGTLATQNANAVAITGGSATVGNLAVTVAATVAGDLNVDGGQFLVDAAQNRTTVVTQLVLGSPIGLGGKIELRFDRTTQPGMVMAPGGDVGGFVTIDFLNGSGVRIGSINQTSTNVAFNTSSDARLKYDVDDLTGELALVQALRPVSFKWLADDSPGVGFLASEVAQHVQGVITGEADELNPDGTIKPQMIDYSKLVPFLVGAIKTLTARVAVLEDALGI